MLNSTLIERIKCSLFFSGYNRLHCCFPAGWKHLGTHKSESVAASALPVLFNLSDIGECFQKKFSAGCFWDLHLFWVNSNESTLLRKFQGGCIVVLLYIKIIIFCESKVIDMSVKSIGRAHTTAKSAVQSGWLWKEWGKKFQKVCF